MNVLLLLSNRFTTDIYGFSSKNRRKKKRHLKPDSRMCTKNVTSINFIFRFHPATLKKKVEIMSEKSGIKSGKNKNPNFTLMRLPILSVEFCCARGLGVQPSTSPSEHCYDSEEPCPK